MEKGTAGSKVKGRFLRRLNRFLAEVEIGGSIERCHVKNTGRLRELLVPGSKRPPAKSTGIPRGRPGFP